MTQYDKDWLIDWPGLWSPASAVQVSPGRPPAWQAWAACSCPTATMLLWQWPLAEHRQAASVAQWMGYGLQELIRLILTVTDWFIKWSLADFAVWSGQLAGSSSCANVTQVGLLLVVQGTVAQYLAHHQWVDTCVCVLMQLVCAYECICLYLSSMWMYMHVLPDNIAKYVCVFHVICLYQASHCICACMFWVKPEKFWKVLDWMNLKSFRLDCDWSYLDRTVTAQPPHFQF